MIPRAAALLILDVCYQFVTILEPKWIGPIVFQMPYDTHYILFGYLSFEATLVVLWQKWLVVIY